MTRDYLLHETDMDDLHLISVMDELPLWSAPFGIELLNTIAMNSRSVLEIGCGTGFPLIEIAQRLGKHSVVAGLDVWEQALRRVGLKCRTYALNQVQIVRGRGETLPFHSETFDLIVSNNGITNADDPERVIMECGRVSRENAQFVVTYNLEGTLSPFYSVLRSILEEKMPGACVKSVDAHIHRKRMPLTEMERMLNRAGFSVLSSVRREFTMRFRDAETFFNHSLIKYWFLESWKSLVPETGRDELFGILEERLNGQVADDEIRMPVPFVRLDCRKKNFQT
jgi:arsenite methyltransferase